jgi:hypothetical protein
LALLASVYWQTSAIAGGSSAAMRAGGGDAQGHGEEEEEEDVPLPISKVCVKILSLIWLDGSPLLK